MRYDNSIRDTISALRRPHGKRGKKRVLRVGRTQPRFGRFGSNFKRILSRIIHNGRVILYSSIDDDDDDALRLQTSGKKTVRTNATRCVHYDIYVGTPHGTSVLQASRRERRLGERSRSASVKLELIACFFFFFSINPNRKFICSTETRTERQPTDNKYAMFLLANRQTSIKSLSPSRVTTVRSRMRRILVGSPELVNPVGLKHKTSAGTAVHAVDGFSRLAPRMTTAAGTTSRRVDSTRTAAVVSVT